MGTKEEVRLSKLFPVKEMSNMAQQQITEEEKNEEHVWVNMKESQVNIRTWTDKLFSPPGANVFFFFFLFFDWISKLSDAHLLGLILILVIITICK